MKKQLWMSLFLLVVIAAIVAACAPAAQPTQAPATQVPAAKPTEPPAAKPTEPPAAKPTEPPAAAPTTAPAAGKVNLSMWTHSAGNKDELATIQKMVDAFNAKQDQFEVKIEAFPQASYNDSVAAASVAKSLPDIIDLDGPTVPNFAWSGYVQALPITDADVQKMGVLANDVGRYNGKIYSLGQFDVALLNYSRKSILDKAGIRIPTVDKPWTLDEFTGILKKLKDSGTVKYAFDLNPQYTGEWWPYAYSPMLQSFGGDLIDRKTYQTAQDALNGPDAVKWAQWFQDLFKQGYANPKPADDQCFLQGNCAIWYTGSWSADAVVKQFGDDALFLPAVDFGHGPKIGAGSWQWGVSATSQHADGAWQFISFLMQPEQIALMSQTTGLIPTTPAAAALTTKYKEGGPYRAFFDMADKFALVRPPTPGYLRLSSEFERAGVKIRDGGDVQNTLDDAVDAINRDIKDNKGYGFQP